MSTLNPWLALVLGLIVGWVLGWLLEVFFFRRERLECQRRAAQLEADLAACQASREALQAEKAASEAELAALQQEFDARLEAALAGAAPWSEEEPPAEVNAAVRPPSVDLGAIAAAAAAAGLISRDDVEEDLEASDLDGEAGQPAVEMEAAAADLADLQVASSESQELDDAPQSSRPEL